MHHLLAKVHLGSRGGLSLFSCISWGCSLRRLLLLGCLARCASFSFTAIRRCPQGQVVPKQLHDESAVAVGFLRKRVQLSNGIIESLLGEMASPVRRVQDLVVEDTEVEGETETDRVCWSEFSLRDIGGILGGR